MRKRAIGFIVLLLLLSSVLPGNASETQQTQIVQQVQRQLQQLGYNPGAIDGIMGKKTRMALYKFQQQYNLLPSGELDQSTLQALGISPLSYSRVALVIGNATYQNNPLHNTLHDAHDMTAMLKKLNFDVMLHTNITRRKMKHVIREFGQRLKSEQGIGLFYYSGHGIQYQNRNYLIPLAADVHSATDIEFETIAADYVLQQMNDAQNGLNLVILDACRNNPFQRSFSRSIQRGLAVMDAPKGTLIAFATAPNMVAFEGEGRNGIFTKHLLAALRTTPHWSITDLLIEVTAQVDKETQGKQVPWQHVSLTQRFAFASSSPSLPIIETTPHAIITPTPSKQPGVEELRQPDGAKNDIVGIWDIYMNGMKNTLQEHIFRDQHGRLQIYRVHPTTNRIGVKMEEVRFRNKTLSYTQKDFDGEIHKRELHIVNNDYMRGVSTNNRHQTATYEYRRTSREGGLAIVQQASGSSTQAISIKSPPIIGTWKIVYNGIQNSYHDKIFLDKKGHLQIHRIDPKTGKVKSFMSNVTFVNNTLSYRQKDSDGEIHARELSMITDDYFKGTSKSNRRESMVYEYRRVH